MTPRWVERRERRTALAKRDPLVAEASNQPTLIRIVKPRPWLEPQPMDYPSPDTLTLTSELSRLAGSSATMAVHWHSPLRSALMDQGLIEPVWDDRRNLWIGDRITAKGRALLMKASSRRPTGGRGGK